MKDNNSCVKNAEEEVILDFFGDLKGDFLSIGEGNGEYLSNVRALAEIGWGGVCVEPEKNSFEELSQLYEGIDHIRCSNFAVSTITSLIRFLIAQHNDFVAGTMFWTRLFQISSIKKFDFVSIKVGDSSLGILRYMDLKEMGVKLLCIEWNSSRVFRSGVDSFLRDYTLIYVNDQNLIYKLDGINN